MVETYADQSKLKSLPQDHSYSLRSSIKQR